MLTLLPSTKTMLPTSSCVDQPFAFGMLSVTLLFRKAILRQAPHLDEPGTTIPLQTVHLPDG